jgi:hypothetical protein
MRKAALGLACGLMLAGTGQAQRAPTAIMGVHGPEDFERIPGTPLVIVSQLYTLREKNVFGDLALLDTARDRVRPLPIRIAREKGWGDASCMAPPRHIGPHGIHLSRRRGGRLQLLVVNHQERESIEYIEIARDGRATWRGCVTSEQGFNDVVAVPGGFVATVPVAHGQPEKVDGTVAGYLTEWRPGRGFKRLPGSDAAYNNGVQASADGRIVTFASWTRRELIRYDTKAGRITGRVKLDFMPDNLSTQPDGTYLVAGIDGLPGPGTPKLDGQLSPGFTVVRLDPRSMKVTPVYKGRPGEMAGASIALQVGGRLYLGSYTGGRILKLAMPRR